MKLKQKHPTAFLLCLCYAACLLGLLLLHLLQFAGNRIAHQKGAFPETQLTLADFTLEGLVEKDGVLVSTTTDPQMLLQDTQIKADAILLEAEFVYPPHLLMAFYAPPGQDYSVRNGVYGQTQGNTTLFLLPPSGGQSIRIDPGDVVSNPITIHKIILNPPRSIGSFFVFAPLDWTILSVAPALAASGISILGQGLALYQSKRKGDEPIG